MPAFTCPRLLQAGLGFRLPGFASANCQLPLLGGDSIHAQFMPVAVLWSSLDIPSLRIAFGLWVTTVHSTSALCLSPNLARDPVCLSAHGAFATACGGLL